jgi:DNA-directed RNA polymerase II subunit RPB1
MGIVKDTMWNPKFTLRDTFLELSQVQNILLWVREWGGAVPIPAIVKPKPLWSGKQVLSVAAYIYIALPIPNLLISFV